MSREVVKYTLISFAVISLGLAIYYIYLLHKAKTTK